MGWRWNPDLWRIRFRRLRRVACCTCLVAYMCPLFTVSPAFGVVNKTALCARMCVLQFLFTCLFGGMETAAAESPRGYNSAIHVFFKVRVDDGNVYILRHLTSVPNGEWELVAFRESDRS